MNSISDCATNRDRVDDAAKVLLEHLRKLPEFGCKPSGQEPAVSTRQRLVYVRRELERYLGPSQ